MNKFVVLSLAYVALLAGCSLSNRFFIPGTNMSRSTCGFIFHDPIQSCEGEWCKIYYPCGDTEYYVKKGEIQRLYDLMYPNKK